MSESSNRHRTRAEPYPSHIFVINPQDLPLSCPMKDATLWNEHPRVYLPIEKTGKATCPYCGKHYLLEGGISEKGEGDN